jgi:Protein of unknown function (DUF3147)
MTSSRDEPAFWQAPDEPIGTDPGKLRDIKPQHMLVRFAFGAGTSAAAGVATLAFGARTGGILLAFPAILAASLTLIADEETNADARESARGAVAGAIALTAFAATGAILFERLAPTVVTALATAIWLATALGLYLLLWARPSASTPSGDNQDPPQAGPT